jgi:hypothetical protein
MTSLRFILVSGLVALGAAVPAITTAAGPAKILDTFTVTVGPGPGAIKVLDAKGRGPNNIKTGIYKFVVDHKTTKDNFHILGPKDWKAFYGGANEGSTPAGLLGVRVRRLWTMVPGVYRYWSDAHPAKRYSFRVVR